VRASLVAAAMLFVAVPSCDADRDAELLELRAVEPSQLEPGDRMVVLGKSFPIGRAAEIELDGVLRRAGAAAERAHLTIEGRAVAIDRVQARWDAGALEQMSGGGTFHGTLRVSFASADGDGTVSGALRHVELDFARPMLTPLTAGESGDEEAGTIADALGLGLADEELAAGGIRIESVGSRSAAARAGLRAGDEIVTANGVRVGAQSDLLPGPNDAQLELRIRRRGEVALMTARVGLLGLDTRRDAEQSAVATWIALALALVLVFLAPSARWLGALEQIIDRARRRERESRAESRSSDIVVACALTIVVGAAAVLPASMRAQIDAPTLYLVAAALALALGALRGGARGGVALGAAVIDAVTMGLVAAVAILWSGATAVEAIVRAQAPGPWGWLALQSPAGTTIAIVLVVTLALRDARGRVARFRVETFLSAALGASLLLGGWQPPWQGAGVVWGAIALVAKTWALWAASRVVSPSLGERAGWRVRAPMIAVAIAAGIAAFAIPDVAPILAVVWSRFIAAVALASIACACVALLRRAHARGPAGRPLELHGPP